MVSKVTLLHICGVIPTPQSPGTPRDRRHLCTERWRLCTERRRLRIERRYRHIEWPPRDRRRRCSERRYRHIEWWVFEHFMMFHNVLSVSWCFTSGSRCFTSGSRCFTMYHNVLHVFHDVLLCLTMFYDVYRVAQRSATAWPPIGSVIATMPQGLPGLAITPQKLAMAPQGSSISPRTWSHAKLRPEWRLE